MHALTAMILAIIGANGSYRPVRLVAIEWPERRDSDQDEEQAEKGAWGGAWCSDITSRAWYTERREVN